MKSDVRREETLAEAAIKFCDLPEAEKEATMRKVAEFYEQEFNAVCQRYGLRN